MLAPRSMHGWKVIPINRPTGVDLSCAPVLALSGTSL
jgi:hypothetical protein